MNTVVIPDYKGFVITVNDGGVFNGTKEGKDMGVGSTTLDATKKLIDVLSKAKFGFEVIALLGDTWQTGRVTSCEKESFGNRMKYRIQFGKDWHTFYATELIKKTPADEEVAKKLNENRDKKKALENEGYTLRSKLSTYNDEELQNHIPAGEK